MASSSPEKSLEKQQPKPTRKPSHVSLAPDMVERMKGIQNWGEKFRWTYDEGKIRRINEIQQNMDINDLLWYVMHGDGEEVVWHDDVWNLQGITQVPEAKEPRENIAEPPPPPIPTEEEPLQNGKC